MTIFLQNNSNQKKRSLLSPSIKVLSVLQVDLNLLANRGKKVILIDVDNTIVGWHGSVVSNEIVNWFQKGKQLGFKFCLVSNTNKVNRLRSIAQQADIPYVRGLIKPSRSMFKKALALYDEQPQNAIMIGDQLFTDVLGANRSQIDSIWVEPLTPKDFWSTKISRLAERIVVRLFHKK